MNKIAAAFIALTFLSLPGTILADMAQTPEVVQALDESEIVVIVNQTPEQDLSQEEQILSPEVPEAGDEVSQEEETQASSLVQIEEIPVQIEPTFDIPMTLNEKVELYIHYFTNRIRDKFSVWLARSEMYLPMMKKTFREKGLPEDLTYLALIESGFNNKAYSRAKATGQWQFMRGTGKRYGLKIDRWVDERRDPEKATEAAAEYLGDLYAMFNDWHLAAAGYNAGEGKIGRAIKKYDTNDFWQLSQSKYKYLRRETKDYVPKLIAAAMIAKEPAKYGFDDIEYHPSLTYEKVSINRMMDLRDIARVSNCSLEELQNLNPALKTVFTPANYRDFELNVPMGKKEMIEFRIASLPAISEAAALKEVGPEKTTRVKKKSLRTKRVQAQTASINYASRKLISYVVKEGESLWSIALKYGVEVRNLTAWNNIGNQHKLKPGQRLNIYVGRESGRKVS